MVLYDVYGNPIEASGTSTDFSVAEFASFTNNDGESARQAVLTYKGRKLYPKNYTEQRIDTVKKYDGVAVVFGDSYTCQMGTIYEDFAAKHGFSAIDNRGVVGSKIAGVAGNSPAVFWERLDTVVSDYANGYAIDGTTYSAEDVKLFVFMGGANDGWDDATIGENVSDASSKETIYGSLHYMFTQIIKTFTNADIVVILQPAYSNSTGGTGMTSDEQAAQYGFSSLADAQALTDGAYGKYVLTKKEAVVREMAEWYGLNICDCVFNWYNPINENDRSYWTADGHMTAAGYQAIIDKLEKTVNNLPFSRRE